MQSDWSWRLPSLLQCIFSIIIAIAIFFTPESPRWLISKDRSEEAFEILVKYHTTDGDRENQVVQLEYNEIVAALKMDKEADRTGWIDLVKTPGNRKRIGIITAIGFFSQWSGNGLIRFVSSSYTSLLTFPVITCPQYVDDVTGNLLTLVDHE